MQRYDAGEVVEPQQGWFAALPGKPDLGNPGGVLRGDVIGNEALEYGVAHPELLLPWIEAFLLEVIAIGTGEVAARADRLAHDLKGPCRGLSGNR
ncbi:hypothetical protein D3C86_1593400 [compost metagenome]